MKDTIKEKLMFKISELDDFDSKLKEESYLLVSKKNDKSYKISLDDFVEDFIKPNSNEEDYINKSELSKQLKSYVSIKEYNKYVNQIDKSIEELINSYNELSNQINTLLNGNVNEVLDKYNDIIKFIEDTKEKIN